MGRRKTMPELKEILHRLKLGQSKRTIQKETGTHRTIIREMERLAAMHGWFQSETLPSEEEIMRVRDGQIGHALHPLDLYREYIKGLVDREVSYTVIHRLIKEKHPCDESTVRRYIKRTFPETISPVIRREAEPGIMEVDFGYLGMAIDDLTGKKVKVKVFSGRLRYSRKAYRKVVTTERQDVFFQCHIQAFEEFGGVPLKVVPDNLKAAVIKASFEDPLVNRSYRSLAEHYGFTISPCPPRTPEHKGGVENDIKYIKRNFLPWFKEKLHEKGREIPYVSEIQEAMDLWSEEVAHTRIIRVMGRSPEELFEDELPTLKELPPTSWDSPVWKKCRVGRDYRIQFENAYYSVPYRYTGDTVYACGTFEKVRIFKDFSEIASHNRATRKYQTVSNPDHSPPNAEEYLNLTTPGLLKQASLIDEAVKEVAGRIFEDRAVDGIRPVRALIRLEKQYGRERLIQACGRALKYETATYRSVKSILEKRLDLIEEVRSRQEPFLNEQFRFARDPNYFSSANHEKGDEYERAGIAQTETGATQVIGNSRFSGEPTSGSSEREVEPYPLSSGASDRRSGQTGSQADGPSPFAQ